MVIRLTERDKKALRVGFAAQAKKCWAKDRHRRARATAKHYWPKDAEGRTA